jgi:hypothetical protein
MTATPVICPECNAKMTLRLAEAPPPELRVKCLKCGVSFRPIERKAIGEVYGIEEVEEAKPPAGYDPTAVATTRCGGRTEEKATSTIRRAKRAANEDEDDRPRRQGKKSGSGLVLGLSIGGGVLVLLGIVVLVVVLKSDDKGDSTQADAGDQAAKENAEAEARAKKSKEEAEAMVKEKKAQQDAEEQAARQRAEEQAARQRAEENAKAMREAEARNKASEEPYDLKGDKLGMSLQDFKGKYRRSFQDGTRTLEAPFFPPVEEPWHPKAGIVTARITYPFEDFRPNKHTPTLAGIIPDNHMYWFIDDRLYQIVYVVPHSGVDKILDAMMTTYGKPKTVTTEEYQNGFGAKYTGVNCVWDNGVSRILLVERFGNLKTSCVIFIHHELGKVAESRQSRFKPGL